MKKNNRSGNSRPVVLSVHYDPVFFGARVVGPVDRRVGGLVLVFGFLAGLVLLVDLTVVVLVVVRFRTAVAFSAGTTTG